MMYAIITLVRCLKKWKTECIILNRKVKMKGVAGPKKGKGMKRKAVFAGFAAFIYAINIVIGTSFKEHGGFGYMFTDKWNLLKGAGAVALYTVLFGILLCLAYTGLERIKVKNSLAKHST